MNTNHLRAVLFIMTLVVVGAGLWIFSLFARGYSFSLEDKKFNPNGILVIKSEPDAAQIYVDGELEGATNTTLNLAPGTYDVVIKKEGFLDWSKRLTIEKEIVTQVTAHIFKSAPSLTAITFSGVVNPVASDDMSKVAYSVPTIINDNDHNENKAGLWIMETVNLPVGFARDPRRITDGSLAEYAWRWSPNGREVLLSNKRGAYYLLDAGKFTPQNELVNISTTADEILTDWEDEREKILVSRSKRLPEKMEKFVTTNTSAAVFSADEDMVLYTASASAVLENNLIKPVPGSSTQKQERDIKVGQSYVYDIKEDRNFLIDSEVVELIPNKSGEVNTTRRLSWFPTSRHLVLTESDKVTIMDYDGTNRQVVFSGAYVAPHAYASLNINRLLILTNLGGNGNVQNLYSLDLK